MTHGSPPLMAEKPLKKHSGYTFLLTYQRTITENVYTYHDMRLSGFSLYATAPITDFSPSASNTQSQMHHRSRFSHETYSL